MGLKEEIQRRRSEVRTDGYPMSIGELINLYRDGELEIHPEFQRFFRWTNEQKSRFVESLLLGIPIPSFFVSQRPDGVWDVIDGLQRLSTIFELVGILKDEHHETLPPLTLTRTRYLPSLEGKKWEDDGDSSIGVDHQLLIKRTKLDLKIILRESTESTKYELFQRLNSGGSLLSDQELRNCILVSVQPEAYSWLTRLAEDENFKACIMLTDKAELEQYHIELIVRFLVFRRLSENDMGKLVDIGEFLTDEIVKLVQLREFDKETEEAAFLSTFRQLAQSTGADSFRRYSPELGRYLGGFLISTFEALAIGLGYHYERWGQGTAVPDVSEVSKQLWSNELFKSNTGSGVRASSRIPIVIPLGRRLLQ